MGKQRKIEWKGLEGGEKSLRWEKMSVALI
jgi:hypothetical protein